MPMNPGSVNSAGVGTGMAKELFDDYSPKLGIVPGAHSADGLQKVADLCNSIAKVMVAHIAANATVSTTVAAGIAVQVAVPAGSGATTLPGAGTGTVA